MPEPTELPARQRRLALDALSRERLSQITERYDLTVADRRVAASHVDAIVRAKRVDFAEVLGLLGRDELKAVCETLGLDTSGREKQTLLDRVLGRSNGAPAVSRDEVAPGIGSASVAPPAPGAKLTRPQLEGYLWAAADILRGLGMSPALSTRFKRLSRRVLSIQTARSLHFLVFVWFVVVIVTHVLFVFTTGLLANLNHIYGGRDDDSWVGFTVFALSMVVLIVGWVAATPLTLRHPRVVQRVGFALIGPVQGLFEHVDSTAGLYTEGDISPYFWRNGKLPDSEKYATLLATNFAGYRLRIGGLVDNPVDLTLEELRALPHHEQITQHFCIQGWSGVAKWGGVSLQTILDLVRPKPEAKWVVFYSFADGPEGGIYYDVHAIEQMRYKLTMLAYDMNGQPLPPDHGAPLRLRNETQLGFKQVKWIKGLEFVADFADIGGGYGGYHQDHEFFGYRQSI